MSHQPLPCPFCDGYGVTHEYCYGDDPTTPECAITARCEKCHGSGTLRNGTLPGIEPAPPPPAPKDQKRIDTGQTTLF